MTKPHPAYVERDIHVALVCDHRERMFLEAGHDPGTLRTMTAHFGPWLREQIERGGYFGRVVEIGGEAVASIGLMAIAWPPHPMHPSRVTESPR